MNFLEKDLEEIIFETGGEKIRERGLCIKGFSFRQLKIGNYGIADIVTFERDYSEPMLAKITVFELKKNEIGVSAFLQALRYVRGIDSYLKHRGVKFNYYFEISLCGRDIEQADDYVYLCDFINTDGKSKRGLTYLSNYIYSYGVDGIKFTRTYGYSLIDEGF